MVTFSGELVGTLDTILTHDASGAQIRTTPPKDNGGEGNQFSPTDLCAASLGSCATTVMALAAQKHGIPLRAIKFNVTKEMQPSPRRLGTLSVKYIIDSPCDAAQWETLILAGKTCPVRLSLSSDVKVIEHYQRA